MTEMITETVGGLEITRWPDAAAEDLRHQRHISVGAFFDRFGALKWAVLADSSDKVKAVIQDASVRKYIDLDNVDLPAGLAILQAAGHAIDPVAILAAPIQPHELP